MNINTAREIVRKVKSGELSGKKVTLVNIVFLQGEDYNQLESELNESDTPEFSVWLDDQRIMEYLLQWYDSSDDHYSQETYSAEDINTEFLGYMQNIDNNAWLFSRNTHIGYAGLSKILSID